MTASNEPQPQDAAVDNAVSGALTDQYGFLPLNVRYEAARLAREHVQAWLAGAAIYQPQPPITLYAVGLCVASVCTSQSDDETLRHANLVAPTGLDHGWQISGDSTFRTGQTNPCPCDKQPDTHRHILLEC